MINFTKKTKVKVKGMIKSFYRGWSMRSIKRGRSSRERIRVRSAKISRRRNRVKIVMKIP